MATRKKTIHLHAPVAWGSDARFAYCSLCGARLGPVVPRDITPKRVAKNGTYPAAISYSTMEMALVDSAPRDDTPAKNT